MKLARKLTRRLALPVLSLTAVAAALLLVAGCDSALDTEPTNVISEEQVFEDEALADAYLNDIYTRVSFARDGFNDLPYERSFNQMLYPAMGAELRPRGSFQAPYGAANATIDADGPPTPIEYWKYPALREANDFIEQIAASDNLDEDFVNQRRAEARFLRAFMYFEMARRYGAVPLITTAQDADTPRDSLLVERTPEQEMYDFVISETDAIADVLPQTVGGDGRPTRWAALSLQSRAALQAASVGEFGDMKLDGLLGVPDSETQDYWQTAFDAADAVIENSGHSLYRASSDPAENFQALFIDEGNSEGIMYEKFNGVQKGHDYTRMAMPAGFAETWGSNFNPFLRMMEKFEFADGSPYDISRDELTSQQWTVDELFKSRDPRFRASFFYPESDWQDGTVYFHSATRVDGQLVSSGTVGEDFPASGPTRNTTRTGFHVRKRVDEGDVVTVETDADDTDIFIFRLAELYLNRAEAAYYLGNQSQALSDINEIRDRAGMPPKDEATVENIRNERNVELAFEGFHYWDLRRWRTAEEVLGGLRTKGLDYTYDLNSGKYEISLVNAEGDARTFQERHYYLPLGTEKLADNPNLVENPGYASGGGS